MRYLILFFLLTSYCFAQPSIKQGLSLYYQCEDESTKSIHLIDGKATGFYTKVLVVFCDNTQVSFNLLGDENDDLNFRDKVEDYEWVYGKVHPDSSYAVELYGKNRVLLARIIKNAEDEYFGIENFSVSIEYEKTKSSISIINSLDGIKIINPNKEIIDEINIFSLLGYNLYRNNDIASTSYSISKKLLNEKIIFLAIRTKEKLIFEKLILK